MLAFISMQLYYHSSIWLGIVLMDEKIGRHQHGMYKNNINFKNMF